MASDIKELSWLRVKIRRAKKPETLARGQKMGQVWAQMRFGDFGCTL